MSRRRNARDADLFRRRVRQLLDAGWTASAIARETGKSYRHTKQVVDQIRAEEASELGENSQYLGGIG